MTDIGITPGQPVDTSRGHHVDTEVTGSRGHGGVGLDTPPRSVSPQSDEPLSIPFRAFLRALPAWRRDALCLEYPHLSWFGESRAEADAARAVCRDCLVKDPCLWWAVEHQEKGIWGGTTEGQRRAMRGQRR